LKSGDADYAHADSSKIGYPKAPANKFASCLRIVDPQKLETLFMEEFEGTNEVVFSHFIATTLGGRHSTDTFLIVGTGIDV
jgi:hypothetical protein